MLKQKQYILKCTLNILFLSKILIETSRYNTSGLGKYLSMPLICQKGCLMFILVKSQDFEGNKT